MPRAAIPLFAPDDVVERVGGFLRKDAEELASTTAKFAVPTYILGTCVSSLFDRIGALGQGPLP